VISLLLFNVCPAEPGFKLQRLENAIDFRIINILAIFQVKLDFSFKILTISGMHISRTPLGGLCLNSAAYIYHNLESFSIKSSKIYRHFQSTTAPEGVRNLSKVNDIE
jgi:hypothetical protein